MRPLLVHDATRARPRAPAPRAPAQRAPALPRLAPVPAQQPSIYTHAPDPSWKHAHQHWLQRTIGNQATLRAEQRRAPARAPGALRVAPADSAPERAADATAAALAAATPQAHPPSISTAGAAAQTPQHGQALQRAPQHEAAGGRAGGALSQGFARELEQSRAGGRPLDAATRAQMEAGIGADFGGVRLHTGEQANRLSRAINADAFTSGRDIFFRDGVGNPATPGGQHVLAHELTHVVQQGGAQQGGAQRQPIQRLMTAAQFRKTSRLSVLGVGHKGKSDTFMNGVAATLTAYHGPFAARPAPARIKLLDTLTNIISQWLHGLGTQSSRRDAVYKLKLEVDAEIYTLRRSINTAPAVQAADFTDANRTGGEDAKYGAAMSSLDEIVYNFMLEADDTGVVRKTAGGEFIALFKRQLAQDPLQAAGEMHRGAGIPLNNPQFAERNLAMQEVDRLLGANVIPPTFLAQHNGRLGFIMEKVIGKTQANLNEEAAAGGPNSDAARLRANALENPLVRKGLSRLYLLDQICAQMDRHTGNYMVVIENGVIKGIKGIDNDLAFGADSDLNTAMDFIKNPVMRRQMTHGKLADELKEIDRGFAQRIVELSRKPEVLRNALQPLLTPREIDETVSRLTRLADFLRPMLADPNNPVMKTKWE